MEGLIFVVSIALVALLFLVIYLVQRWVEQQRQAAYQQ